MTTAALISPRSDGSLRIGLSSGVLDWKDGEGKILEPAAIQPSANLQAVAGMVEETDGSTLGMVSPGAGLGIQRLSKDGRWTPFEVPGFDGSTISVMSLHEDTNGSLWVGTLGDGIYRIHNQTLSQYGRADGLSSNGVFDSYEDREGDIWFITAMGIDQFRNQPVVSHTDAEGLNAVRVAAVLASRDGTAWLSNGTGLNFIRDGKVQTLTRSNGLQGDRIASLLEDYQGRL